MPEPSLKLTYKYGGYWKMLKSGRRAYALGQSRTVVAFPDYYSRCILIEDLSQISNWASNHCLEFYCEVPNSRPIRYEEITSDGQLYQCMLSNLVRQKMTIYVTTVDSQPLASQSVEKSKVSNKSGSQMDGKTVVDVDDGDDGDVGDDVDVEDAGDAGDVGDDGDLQSEDNIDVDYENIFMHCESMSDDDDGEFVEFEDEYNESEENGSGDELHSEDSYHSRPSMSDESQDGPVSDDEGDVLEVDPENPDISVGAVFANCHEYRIALRQYAIKNQFEFKQVKNDNKRITVVCADLTCKWRVHASRLQDGVTFAVKTMQEEHTCSSTSRCDSRMASNIWISERVKEVVKENSDIPPKKLQSDLLKRYNISIPYHRIWRARCLAREKIFGRVEESYRMLPQFLNELKESDATSVLEYKLGLDGCFQRVFIALGATISGFLHGCRPVLGIDGCHLKGFYTGILLAAVAVDGNNCLFPVAYGVVEGENIDSWTWFLHMLKKAVGHPEGLTFISDMDKGIQVAVGETFSGAEHRFCMRHLYKNFKKKWPGPAFQKYAWSASKCYTIQGYQAAIFELEKLDAQAATYLESLRCAWSRCQFGELSKLNYITNNLSESFNSFVGDSRGLPLVDMLDAIRQKIMVKMEVRRRHARKLTDEFVPPAVAYLNAISRQLGKFAVRFSTDFMAEVDGPTERHVVKLDEKTCTCRKWQVSGLPCQHVAAAVDARRGLQLKNFVDKCYSREYYKLAYAQCIQPLADKNMWAVVSTVEVLPPKCHRPRGRPKKHRIRGPDEKEKATRRHHRCTRCQQFGHHKNTCKEPLPSAVSTVTGKLGPRRPPRFVNRSGLPGHNSTGERPSQMPVGEGPSETPLRGRSRRRGMRRRRATGNSEASNGGIGRNPSSEATCSTTTGGAAINVHTVINMDSQASINFDAQSAMFNL